MLKAKPRLLIGVRIHLASRVMTEVEFVGSAIVVPAFAHNKDVVAPSERIREDSNGAEVDIGVVARSLTAR